jgi:hypothetical protein
MIEKRFINTNIHMIRLGSSRTSTSAVTFEVSEAILNLIYVLCLALRYR